MRQGGQLYGLRVRHFKVSGGVPSPPEQPQLVLEWKTRRVKQTNECAKVAKMRAEQGQDQRFACSARCS